MAEVRLSRRAVQDLDSLPKRSTRRVLDALHTLGVDPSSEALDVKPLAGMRPWRRLRVGDHRVLFRFGKRGAILLVARVVDRKDLKRAIDNLPG